MTPTSHDGPTPQPFLHDLVTCLRAPTAALSGQDGQIHAEGAQGVFQHDLRILSELTVAVDGHQPVAVGHHSPSPDEARFVAVVRHLGDSGADPTVTLHRRRRATTDGLEEELTLINTSRGHVSATVTARAAVDFAPMDAVKHGRDTEPSPPRSDGDHTAWASQHAHTTLRATGDPQQGLATDHVRLTWRVSTAPGGTWTARVTVSGSSRGPDSLARFRPGSGGRGRVVTVVSADGDVSRLVERGMGDIGALSLADLRAPDDTFAAAGSPWYLTLFGRDSLWAARLALPFGTDLAAGTLRALARRQGTRHDPETGEAPGKIPHELRGPAIGMGGLPPVYFGTVDATALWICLLHDAWRWGMPVDAGLLDPLDAALTWLTEHADPDGDGLLEYVDQTGRGLANQGWKDSGDAIQFPDGTLADAPIALSEAQAYAHQAAICGAVLLEAFSRPGAARLRAWASRLRERFREAFWVDDARGRFPAVALDRRKRPVATAASNLGHLLGTGLLDPSEAAAVAARLAEPDLDCGHGLRTMSADAAGFNPLGYHTGSVWPHDTAIAVHGLVRDGHPEVAASLAAGLLRAAPTFGHRLPELFAGTDARRGEPVLAYPAACRPQAWSAAAPLALLATALGLDADVPAGTLRIAPPAAFMRWFPLRVDGLQVAGRPLSVSVNADVAAHAETDAPVKVYLPAADHVPAPREPQDPITIV